MPKEKSKRYTKKKEPSEDKPEISESEEEKPKKKAKSKKFVKKEGNKAWLDHVKKTREKEGCSYKEALQLAKKTYKSKVTNDKSSKEKKRKH